MTLTQNSDEKWPIAINIASGTSRVFGLRRGIEIAVVHGHERVEHFVRARRDAAHRNRLRSADERDVSHRRQGTYWLTTAGNVIPGDIVQLRLAIWDVSDAIFDSTAGADRRLSVARERDASGDFELMELDPRDEEDRALLHAVPSIVAALLSHPRARSEAHRRFVFDARRGDPERARVLAESRDNRDAFAAAPAEIQKLVADAPKMPAVRVVSLRRDGTTASRDTSVTDLTDMEETAPA